MEKKKQNDSSHKLKIRTRWKRCKLLYDLEFGFGLNVALTLLSLSLRTWPNNWLVPSILCFDNSAQQAESIQQCNYLPMPSIRSIRARRILNNSILLKSVSNLTQPWDTSMTTLTMIITISSNDFHNTLEHLILQHTKCKINCKYILITILMIFHRCEFAILTIILFEKEKERDVKRGWGKIASNKQKRKARFLVEERKR